MCPCLCASSGFQWKQPKPDIKTDKRSTTKFKTLSTWYVKAHIKYSVILSREVQSLRSGQRWYCCAVFLPQGGAAMPKKQSAGPGSLTQYKWVIGKRSAATLPTLQHRDATRLCIEWSLQRVAVEAALLWAPSLPVKNSLFVQQFLNLTGFPLDNLLYNELHNSDRMIESFTGMHHREGWSYPPDWYLMFLWSHAQRLYHRSFFIVKKDGNTNITISLKSHGLFIWSF